MKKLYTIAFVLMLHGLTGNLLIGSDTQTNKSNNIPRITATLYHPFTQEYVDAINNKMMYATQENMKPRTIAIETKYHSTMLIQFSESVNEHEMNFVKKGTNAAIQAYENQVSKDIDSIRTPELGVFIMGATLGAAITYACMKNKK